MKNMVHIVGVGPGAEHYLTKAAMEVIESSDVLIGGHKNLIPFEYLRKEVIYIGSRLEEVSDYISDNLGLKKIAVVVSGDPGLYSVMEFLKTKLEDFEFEVIPGISSLQYLCSKMKASWNDAFITSLHGRKQADILDIIKKNKKVVVFTGGDETPSGICQRIVDADMSGLKVTIGENLSYDNERIEIGNPYDFSKMEFDSLSLMIIEHVDNSEQWQSFDDKVVTDTIALESIMPERESFLKTDDKDRNGLNEDIGFADESSKVSEFARTSNAEVRPSVHIPEHKFAWKYDVHGIPDDMFYRTDVPMTKEEVRSISLSKLRLKHDNIIFDIGAGTGSVSIEAALRSPLGKVYSIEKEQKAIDVINKNIAKFGTSNVKVIEGEALEVLDSVEIPNRVFIGGSNGYMEEVIDWTAKKCEDVRIVINTVTIESTYEAIRGLERNGFEYIEVCNISVSRGKIAGTKHLLQSLNPVYVISAQKGEL